MTRGQLYDSLTTNLKGPSRSFKLGRLTAVLGPIRAGKTSVVDSVRFAHTGTAGGYKADGLIAAQTESGILRVRLQGPNGEIEATGPAKAGPNSSKLKREVVLLPDGDWLEGKNMRTAIAKRFAREVSVEPPPDLSESQAALWRQKVKEAQDTAASPAEVLAIAAKSFDSRAREQNKISNAKKKEIDAAAADLTVRADPAQLEADYKLAVAWEAWSAIAPMQKTLEASLVELETALAAAKQAASEAQAAYEARSTDAAELTRLDGAMLQAQNQVAVVNAMLGAFNIPGLTLACCPLCGARGPCAQCGAEGELDKKQAELRKFGEAAQARWPVLQNEKAQLAATRAAAATKARTTELAVQTLTQQLVEKRATLAQIKTPAESAPAPWTGQPSKVIAEAMERSRQSQKAIGRLEEKKTSRDAAERAAADAEACRHAATRETKRVVKEVEAAAAKMFAENMPANFAAELVLTDKEAELRMAGRDGKFRAREALSGSERAVARIAMRIATAEADKARLVLLDDEDWAALGADGQESMCRMLETADIDQAVVASSVLTPSDLSDKWTTIVLAPSTSAPVGSVMAQLAQQASP